MRKREYVGGERLSARLPYAHMIICNMSFSEHTVQRLSVSCKNGIQQRYERLGLMRSESTAVVGRAENISCTATKNAAKRRKIRAHGIGIVHVFGGYPYLHRLPRNARQAFHILRRIRFFRHII